VEQIDIRRSAGTLIAQRGPDQALFDAAQRADGLNEQGDTAGARAWQQIVRAIESLVRTRPESEPLH
jgi:hypothetical protein